jgi:hypothetical protein
MSDDRAFEGVLRLPDFPQATQATQAPGPTCERFSRGVPKETICLQQIGFKPAPLMFNLQRFYSKHRRQVSEPE